MQNRRYAINLLYSIKLYTAREMQDRIGLQLTVWHVCNKDEAHPMRPLSFGLSQTVTMEITTLDNHTVPGERSTCCHGLSY